MSSFSLLLCVVVVVMGCFPMVSAKEIEVDLQIGFPSGIYIDRVEHPETGDIYRFGRLRHSTVAVRPNWEGIYVVEDVLSVKDTQSIIRTAEAHAKEHGWSKGRHIDYAIRPTKDLSMDVVLSREELANLKNLLAEKLFPKFKRQFGLRPSLLRIEDLFITKYDSLSKENSLAPHMDKNPWSFVIALNDDFSGGGTYFVRPQRVWNVPIGAATIFHGYQLHGAYKITSGSRYVLAGFCDYGNNTDAHFMMHYDPQYDGRAGSSGFRTGDQIIGIERCEFRTKRTELTTDASSSPRSSIAAIFNNDVQRNRDENYDEHHQEYENQKGTCSEGVEEELVSRELVAVTAKMSDDEWQALAQSCEQIAPETLTRIRVRRFIPDSAELSEL